MPDTEMSAPKRFGRRLLRWLNAATDGEGVIEGAVDRVNANAAKVMEPVAAVLPGRRIDAAVVQALTENADRSGTEQGLIRDDIGDPNRVASYNDTAVPVAGRLAGNAVDSVILGWVSRGVSAH